MVDNLSPTELARQTSAAVALGLIEPSMIVNLGRSYTTPQFTKLPHDRIVKGSLDVQCVPTSGHTSKQAKALIILPTRLENASNIDLAVDGAYEFDIILKLMKGGAIVLIHEKIVTESSNHPLKATDNIKKMASLSRLNLSVELIKFGLSSTMRLIKIKEEARGCHSLELTHRKSVNNENIITDEGNLIIYLTLQKIDNAKSLRECLLGCPGVVKTGLFLGMAEAFLVGNPNESHIRIGAKQRNE